MSKQAVSAKLQHSLLKKTDQLVRRLKVSRNQAVEEGLKMWIELKSREILALEMKKASLETRDESLRETQDWEIALNDGLDSEEK